MRMAMDTEMEQCIQNCMTCYRVCEETKVHCLHKGGLHASPDHLTIMADCAKICGTAADFMIRRSDRHGMTCGICAAICESCAAECDRMGDDAEMRHCADICRRCAQSCHAMATAVGT